MDNPLQKALEIFLQIIDNITMEKMSHYDNGIIIENIHHHRKYTSS